MNETQRIGRVSTGKLLDGAEGRGNGQGLHSSRSVQDPQTAKNHDSVDRDVDGHLFGV